MSKPKSHTADIDVTCSAPWHRLNAPAAILRLMRSPSFASPRRRVVTAPLHLGRDTNRRWSGLSCDRRSIVTPNVSVVFFRFHRLDCLPREMRATHER